MPQSVDYSGAMLKLDRAELHIRDLDFLVYHWLRSHRYRITQKIDLQSGQHGFEVALKEPPPREIGPILGDALHNLRSALDLCITANAAVRGADIKNSYFPFARYGGDEIEKMIFKRASGAGEEAMQICREQKPYPGGNDALRGLHEADIVDKHQSIVATAALGTFEVQFLPKAPRRPVGLEVDIHYLGLEPYFVPAPEGSEFDTPAQLGLSVQIVFPANGPLAGHPIVATLYALLDDVRFVVHQFQERCP